MLTVFLMAFIPRIIFVFYMMPIRTLSDEVATISNGAWTAGYNWSAVVSNAGYYGGGFYALFGIVFRLTKDPVIIYRTILFVLCIVQALTAVVAFWMITEFFRTIPVKTAMLMSVICSYFVATRANVMFNETPLVLMVWLIAAALLQLRRYAGEPRKKRKWTVILFLFMGYTLLLHTRSILLWIALVLFIIIYFLSEKQWLTDLKWTIIMGVGTYTLAQCIIRLMQKKIWLSGSVQGLRNASIETVDMTKFLTKSTLPGVFDIVIGQLNTISVFSAGLSCICVVLILRVLIQAFSKRKKYMFALTVSKNVYILFVYFGMCVAMMIAGMAVSWGYGCGVALNEGVHTLQYAVKAFTYIRYFAVFMGPVILAALVSLYAMRDFAKKQVLKESAWLFIILQVIWVCCVLPYASGNTYSREVYMPFALWKNVGIQGMKMFIPGTLIATAVFALIIYALMKKKWRVVCVTLVLYLGFQYGYNSIYYDIYLGQRNYAEIDDSYQAVKALEKEAESPKEIYVSDVSDRSDHNIFYNYQFWMNAHTILPYEPEYGLDEALFFTNGTSQYMNYCANDGYQVFVLDEDHHEYLFVKGRRLIEAMDAAGYQPDTETVSVTQIPLEDMQFNDQLCDPVQQAINVFVSNGNEGIMMYGPYSDLCQGRYEVTLELMLPEYYEGTFAQFSACTEFGTNVLGGTELTMSEDQKGETIRFSIQFDCDAVEAVEYVLTVKSGVVLEVKEIDVKYLYE